MKSSRPSAFRRYCAAAVAASLVLQPMAAYAAPITTSVLAEVPLQGINPVKPNILFTLDDSGSMGWDYLPEWTVAMPPDFNSSQPDKFAFYCRNNRPCGNYYLAPPVGSLPLPGNFAPYRQIDPPIRSSDFNKLYYNPAVSYNPGKRAAGTDLPCEGSNAGCTGPWSAVYMDGFFGYPGANTSGSTINLAPTSTTGCMSGTKAGLCVFPVGSDPSDNGPWPGVPDTIWCRSPRANLTGADFQTADGDGSMCRRNGRAYPQTTVGSITMPAITTPGYHYPNDIDPNSGAATVCAANEACLFNNPVTAYGYPFYYRISSVWFCDNKTGGWGTGTCGTRQDPDVFKYVRYSATTSSGPAFDPTAFKRVDIRPASAGGVLVNGAAAANPSGRTYDAEMANIAKWYAFHRTRMLAMKSAGGIAFSALSEENARVGFASLWASPILFRNVAPFTAANKADWFSSFYSATPQGNTPLPDAAWAAGEYFSGRPPAVYAKAVDPLDPVTGQCQRNYHLLSTDGYWGTPLGSPEGIGIPTGTTVGDWDRTVPSSLPAPVPGLTPGNPFPAPYYEGEKATKDTLADLAMNYWIRDLRPSLEDKVQDTIAPWQHVTLYGLSIGSEGNIVYPTGIDAILAGKKDWPVATGSARPDSIDDLWHAALNSRGKYFNAKDPQELATSIVQSLNEFTAQSGTGTAVGIAGAQFTVTKSFGYRTSYEAGWWGDVRKYALDANTGALPIDGAGNPLNPPLWSAAKQLDTQAAGTGWQTNRRIVTINDSSNTVVPFRIDQLSSTQQASLNAGWTVVTPTPSAESVLNYLRGDPSNEGVGTTNFRARSHVLGDIVYSGAVPVGAPSQPYDDTGNPGYSAFASAEKSRTPTVYVGGNDGMLHAFDDSTTSDAGKETWAYIPKAMFTNGDPNDTSHAPDPAFQLGALSWGFSGKPLFSHKFYVNAPPRIWDIDFANTGTSVAPQTGNDWRTILVGGLGAGGRAVYALDVTNPVALADTETAVANSGRVLWEFTDATLGYVFDAPTLVKTKRFGWVALVASGYNNPGGKGFLYVLNPKTGALLLPKIALPGDTGTDTDPTGLSTVRAYTANRRDPYVLQAYGGDLRGNVWRFDLSDADESKWKVELIARLKDANGTAQPITTGIRVEIDQNNNVDRYLFVGTGKLLGPDDINAATVRNTLYVIRDGTRTAAGAVPATPYSRADLNSVNGSGTAGFSGTATGRGWYQDATDLTEKVGVDPYADVQTVVWAFSKPNTTDPCAAPLSSRLFARDYISGNSVLQSEGGAVVPSIDIGAGIAGIALIQGQAGASGASSGDVRVQVTTMRGQVFSFGVNLAGAANLKHRVSWRLLNRN